LLHPLNVVHYFPEYFLHFPFRAFPWRSVDGPKNLFQIWFRKNCAYITYYCLMQISHNNINYPRIISHYSIIF
jgi:hypothetical protein